MKNLQSALLLLAVCVHGMVVREEEDVCLIPPDPGMCKAYMPSFYYDAENGTCKNFIYGGCQGNGNRFHTLAGCQTACMDTCDQPKASGPCYGSFPKFYYDKEADTCQEFIYGGCQGNDNRFDSLEDCHATCG